MAEILKEFLFKMGVYKYAKRFLLKPYKSFYRVMFKLHSKAAIKALIEAMNQNQYKYWLEFGTLLGAIRDKGFISHDYDIDIAMYMDDRTENMEQTLRAKGLILKKRAKLLSGEIIEETYTYKTVYIDVFYAFKEGSQIKIYDYQTFNGLSPQQCMKRYGGLKVHENVLTDFDLIKYDFYGQQVSIPENHHFHLQELYGKDYMIKNKNWDYETSSVRKETNMLAVVEHFKQRGELNKGGVSYYT